jgi:hypothetical protein
VGATTAALLAPSLGAFGLVFVLYGVQGAAINVSNLNVLLEFSPTPEARPTYIGLGTTAMAPMAFAAPLLAACSPTGSAFARCSSWRWPSRCRVSSAGRPRA